MSAQGDCEFLVKRARALVPQDLWAAKAWLITARSLYPADFNIQVRSSPRGGVSRALRPGRPGAWPGHRPLPRKAPLLPCAPFTCLPLRLERQGAHFRGRLVRGSVFCGSTVSTLGKGPSLVHSSQWQVFIQRPLLRRRCVT
jgi:hypothetical protein